jgi:hypothetical protein
MGFFSYLKGVKEAFQEIKEKGSDFPVNLDGPFIKFMLDIQDGDHYIALDTNVLCNNNINFFSTSQLSTMKSRRFVVSEHTIRAFRGSIEQNDEYAELATFALNRVERAMEEGYQISIVSGVTEEEVNHLGFDMSFSSAVISSFYKANQGIERIHNDWRKLYLVTLPTEEESILFANDLGLPTYTLKD